MKNNEKEALLDFRKKLDEIDADIINLLAERFKVTRKIGKLKKDYNLPTLDKSREDAIYKKLENKALDCDLNYEMLKNIWHSIMKQSKKEHEKTY